MICCIGCLGGGRALVCNAVAAVWAVTVAIQNNLDYQLGRSPESIVEFQ